MTKAVVSDADIRDVLEKPLCTSVSRRPEVMSRIFSSIFRYRPFIGQGCFPYKGKKKSVKIDSILRDNEGKATIQRLDMYEELWAELESRVQKLQSDQNTAIFQDVLKYARNAYPPSRAVDCDDKNAISRREIPTAALLTGVNMPDHDVIFTNLVQLFRDEISSHVAVLKSKDCGSIKHMTQTLIEQITEDDPNGAYIRRCSPTISTLANWYDEQCLGVSPLPNKKRRTSKSKSKSTGEDDEESGRKPVIIVMEDLERFNPSVVQDFIMACSNHLSVLPIILVFGVATAVTTIHRLLPQCISSLLRLEKFQAAPSSAYFSQILSETVMTSNFPFKLGGRVFQHLVDIFLMHDFSVTNYTSSLQFLLMDHFYEKKLSVLCRHVTEQTIKDSTEAERLVSRLTKSLLDDIRQCKSVMRFVENAPPELQHSLLLDDKILKEHIVGWLADIQSYHEHFFPVLQCLNIVTSNLPKHPLGRQLREVYGRCLESDIFNQDDYKTCLMILRTMSRDSLIGLLNRCVMQLSEHELLAGEAEALCEYIDRFNQIGNQSASDDTIDGATDTTTENSAAVTQLPKKMDMTSLKKHLSEMKGQKKKITPYENIRQEALQYLDGMFKKYLYSYKSLVLYEAFYCESGIQVKHHINVSPLSALHQALTDPYTYLKVDKTRSEPGSVSPELPDISIVFKLHLECGRLINLYDWLQAFIGVVTSGKKRKKTAKTKEDQLLQARFIRAVCEIQFLGFVKPTKRKTDHVMRLTWGAY